MRQLIRYALAAVAALCAVPVAAQTQAVPVIIDQTGKPRQVQPTIQVDANGAEKATTANPVIIGCTDASNNRTACAGAGGGGTPGSGESIRADQRMMASA